jgi:hypothetical protein
MNNVKQIHIPTAHDDRKDMLMTTLVTGTPTASLSGWLRRVEAWLDARGKGAWIAAMVVGFVVFWPLGLALLAYMIWSKKMICSSQKRRSTPNVSGSTGNTAFDNYRAETLRRLEEEQHNFEAFLQRLREARDKAEFDEFMAERAKAAASGDSAQ